MRLIDADALIEIYANRLEILEQVYGVYSGECGTLAGAMKLLETQPTIDPKRRKGRWIKGICECGYDWAKDAPISSVPNFCPSCGSDMREGESDG